MCVCILRTTLDIQHIHKWWCVLHTTLIHRCYTVNVCVCMSAHNTNIQHIHKHLSLNTIMCLYVSLSSDLYVTFMFRGWDM